MISYIKHLQYSKFLQVSLIILLCIIVYTPSLRNGFIWDDDTNLYKSPWIQEAGGLKVIWFTHKMYQYYPIDFTTFWLEHKLWGLNPFGYHTINLILHILNALLFFWVALKIYPRLAFIPALLFAIHPIQVETVAWITERKNLLSLFFFLLAILAYLRFDRNRGIRYYLLTVIMFVCALLSKSIAVCFIFFPVLYKWWRDGKVTWREIRLSIVFVVIGLLSALYTLYLEFYHVGARGKVFDLTFLERFILSGRIIFFYIYKLLFPFNFMFFYPRWIINTKIWWQWLFPLAVMLVLGVLVIYRGKIGRGTLALFVFYIISIFPVLGFLNVYGMKFSFVADHFSYLSTPCLLLLLCTSIYFLLGKLRIGFPLLMSALYRILLSSLLVIIVIYMCGKSMELTQNYKSEITLWNNLISQNPNTWIAYNNRGFIYDNQGNLTQALSDYNKVIQLNPSLAEIYNNRGFIYYRQGNLTQALSDYNKAIQLNPSLAETYNNRGLIYYKKRDLNKAFLDYNKAIRLDPNLADAYNNRGLAYQNQGNLNQAISDYNKAIQLKPHNYVNSKAYYNRGLAYQNQGNPNQAISDYTKAIEIEPNFAQAYSNLATIYQAIGRNEEAIVLYNRAIALNPHLVETYYNLGNAYRAAGKHEEAIALYKRAITLNPDYVDTYNNLGAVYTAMDRKEEAISSFKKAIEIDQNCVEAYKNLAVIYYLEKKYALAIKYYDCAMALGSEADPNFLKLLEPYRQEKIH